MAMERYRLNPHFFLLTACCLLFSACGSLDTVLEHSVPEHNPSAGAAEHLRPSQSTTRSSSAPLPCRACALEQVAPAVYSQPRYTVVVDDVPVRELLYALTRDAGLNIDIAPDISGVVSMNAVDQGLPEILDRLAASVRLRYEFGHDTLLVRADTPYFKHYPVGYLNLDRETQDTVTVATQMSSTGAGDGAANNTSSTAIQSRSRHDFWQQLHVSVAALIGMDADAATATGKLVVNRAAGVLSVMADSVQHAQIGKLIDELLENLKRQVLIQVTVIEVELNDNYQTGIDWSRVDLGKAGFSIAANLNGGPPIRAEASTREGLQLQYLDTDVDGNRVQAAISLLSGFGEARVLSSPQIMVLNNHTAVLKVVENFVYFEISQNINPGSTLSGSGPLLATTTTPQTIPVGLVMKVTPQVGEDLNVVLSVRPTISSVVRTELDPNPSLTGAQNRVPVVRVREMESVLRLQSREVGVLGGLMQDDYRDTRRAVPFLFGLPLIGELFKSVKRESRKTELVILMRPIVMGGRQV